MQIAKINSQNIATIIEQQIEHDWLVGYSKNALKELIAKKVIEIRNFKIENNFFPNIVLIESDKFAFISGFLAAIIAQAPIFLCNPQWQITETNQILELLKPNIIWQGGKSQTILSTQSLMPSTQEGTIGIATGGSSGSIRFAIHSILTLTASVRGFTTYFESQTINCCCILPLHHISGLIQLWRSLITGGKLALVAYNDLKQNIKPKIDPQSYFLSLVPTQLQYLLNSDPYWLSQFKTVLLGGAPAWQSLLEKARQFDIALSTTYGMTETASGVSYLKPQDFRQKNYSSGKVLPHAQIKIIDQKQELSKNQIGIVTIQSESLCQGYYPQSLPQKSLLTDDLGFIDEEGFLYIVGRNSQKIITGGENVYPQEIEAEVLATKLVKDVCIIGLEDDVWGQAVTALYIPLNQTIKPVKIQQELKQRLSKYKQPKYWFAVDSLHRDQKGKVNYLQLKKVAQKLLDKEDQK